MMKVVLEQVLEHDSFPQNLSNVIQYYHQNFSVEMIALFPDMRILASQVTIPKHCIRDKLTWKHSNNEELTLKGACDFKKPHFPKLKWAKLILSPNFVS